MEKYQLYRHTYSIKSFISNIFNRYGKKTFVILSIYLLGILLGSLIISQVLEDMTSDNIIDGNLFHFLSREKNWFSLYITYLISYFILIIYVICFNKSAFLLILGLCLTFVKGLLLGYSFILYLSIFNIIANIIIIILFPIFNISIFVLWAVMFAISWSVLAEKRRFGRICDYRQIKVIKKINIIFSILIVVLLFIYCLCLNSLLLVIVI